jgi:hypothetical protein
MNKMLDENFRNLLVFTCSACAEQVMCRTYHSPTLKAGLNLNIESCRGKANPRLKLLGDAIWI